MTRRCSILLLLSLLLAISVPAFAQESAVTVRAANSALNVRSGPGLDYTIRGVLYAPYSLNATGRSDFDPGRYCQGGRSDEDMWLRVQFNELEGWVARCAAQIDGEVAALPVVAPAYPEVVTPPSDDEANQRPRYLRTFRLYDPDRLIIHTGALAHLRSEPSLDGELLGTVAAFQPVFFVAYSEGGGWVEVEFGQYTGWIARHLLVMP